MGRTLRALQWVGVALFAGSAFWPVFHFQAYPLEGLQVPDGGVVLTAGGTSAVIGFHAAGRAEIPAQELGSAVFEAVRGPAPTQPFWERRRWYPYFLLPVWILALGLAGQGGRWRRGAGAGLWLVALGLGVFEAAYLRAEYAPFLPGTAGVVEGVCVWLVVLAILFYRRPADRRLGAVEAGVASQALLGFVHALTLPATMARGWLEAFPADAVFQAVLRNYPAAFWVGCAALLVIALPVYLRPLRGARSPG